MSYLIVDGRWIVNADGKYVVGTAQDYQDCCCGCAYYIKYAIWERQVAVGTTPLTLTNTYTLDQLKTQALTLTSSNPIPWLGANWSGGGSDAPVTLDETAWNASVTAATTCEGLFDLVVELQKSLDTNQHENGEYMLGQALGNTRDEAIYAAIANILPSGFALLTTEPEGWTDVSYLRPNSYQADIRYSRMRIYGIARGLDAVETLYVKLRPANIFDSQGTGYPEGVWFVYSSKTRPAGDATPGAYPEWVIPPNWLEEGRLGFMRQDSVTLIDWEFVY